MFEHLHLLVANSTVDTAPAVSVLLQAMAVAVDEEHKSSQQGPTFPATAGVTNVAAPSQTAPSSNAMAVGPSSYSSSSPPAGASPLMRGRVPRGPHAGVIDGLRHAVSSGAAVSDTLLRAWFEQLDGAKKGYVDREAFRGVLNNLPDFGLETLQNIADDVAMKYGGVLGSYDRVAFDEFCIVILRIVKH